MSFDNFHKKRQIIPRWHTYSMAKWLGLLGHTAFPDKQNLKDLEKSINDWKLHGQLPHALDVVGTAILQNEYGSQDAIEAAKSILGNERKSLLAGNMAEDFLRYAEKNTSTLPEVFLPEESRSYWNVIANVKKELREYPRNYIKWAELAFFYSTLGQNDKAKDAMSLAVKGNSDNRFLLLSAARFFLHIDEPDRALYFLRRSIPANPDPWIISAEVAISDALDFDPKEYRRAKKILSDSGLLDFHKSELAGSLGTLEIKAGSDKAGKNYFKQALISPTENTLAQAIHMMSHLGKIDLKDKLLANHQSFEAETQLAYTGLKFEVALNSVKKWMRYQPFSSRPAIQGTYIASVLLEDHNEAIKIAKIGLLASPHDFMLNNNYAFSLISLGRLQEAQKILDAIDITKLNLAEKAVMGATSGALAFRLGNPELGRELYRLACEEFERQKDTKSKAIATYFWKREESLKETSLVLDLNTQLEELLKKTTMREFEFKIKGLK